MSVEKIESVKEVAKAMKEQPIPEAVDRIAPDKNQFQTLLNTHAQPQFQKIDGAFVPIEQLEPSPHQQIVAPENSKVEASGSATDQERSKKGKGQQEQGTEAIGATGSSKSSSTSLMEEVKKLNGQVSTMQHMSHKELKKQAQGVIAQIEQVKQQLSHAQQNNSEIKPSYQTVLRNRLNHIDDSLRIALSKAGFEYAPPPPIDAAAKNPIQRFLSLLTHGQYQLENLHTTVEQLQLSGRELTPGNMLAIQIKVGYMQQQIELFTSILNKALESTKTIMNVQV